MMNYYEELKENLIKCEMYDKVKDYSKNRNRVITYFENGKILKEAGKEYGKNIIKRYSEKLMIEVGKKYNERTLRRMRQFYDVFKDEKWSITWTKLSWSHYREVLSLNNINAIRYYLTECENKKLTIKQLQKIIRDKEYERLPENTKNKLIEKEKLEVNDLIPNPIIIKNNNLNERVTEYVLKELILNNLDDFLKQLGEGFTYLGNEYKIKVDDYTYNYIDILLYNIKAKCYVVVELKVVKLNSNHIGQIQKYMNYVDLNIKTIEENKTVGIIICKEEKEYVIKYCSNPRIISRSYLLV